MTLLDDLSVARRRLARSPGFAALAVVTLALGIGAHTAIFGLVDRLFLKDLPVAEPDRLVGIYESRDGAGGLLVAAALGRIVARLYASDSALDLTVTPATLA